MDKECIYFTPSEEEKVALSKFIERLVRKIHQLDSSLPVMYTRCSNKFPSLDIVGNKCLFFSENFSEYMGKRA